MIYLYEAVEKIRYSRNQIVFESDYKRFTEKVRDLGTLGYRIVYSDTYIVYMEMVVMSETN